MMSPTEISSDELHKLANTVPSASLREDLLETSARMFAKQHAALLLQIEEIKITNDDKWPKIANDAHRRYGMNAEQAKKYAKEVTKSMAVAEYSSVHDEITKHFFAWMVRDQQIEDYCSSRGDGPKGRARVAKRCA